MKTLAAVSLAALIAAAAEASEPRSVVFESRGETLAGHLYLPEGHDGAAPINAVIVTGAWTTVKEQMPAVYARELAARGYAALTFDFRGWGESAGAPRHLEDPTRKTEDILAAAAYLDSLDEVGAIGGLGVCASAGYMVAAANRSEAIGSVALVAPWLHDEALVNAVYGGPEGVAELIQVGREAAAHEARTGEPREIEGASTTNEAALMFGAPYYTDPERGLIPAWDNAFNLASWEGWLTFDAIALASELRDPVVIVHSEAAAIPEGARRFFAAAPTTKRELWLEAVPQFDFYDRPEPVRAASAAVAAHFADTL